MYIIPFQKEVLAICLNIINNIHLTLNIILTMSISGFTITI